MLGKYEFESKPLSNPWTEQFCDDLLSLAPFDGVQQLVRTIEERSEREKGQALRALLDDHDCMKSFLDFDVRQYKAYVVKSKSQAFMYEYSAPAYDKQEGCDEEGLYSLIEGHDGDELDVEDETPYVCDHPPQSRAKLAGKNLQQIRP